jgi:hypothetical protein
VTESTSGTDSTKKVGSKSAAHDSVSTDITKAAISSTTMHARRERTTNFPV